MMRVYRRSYSRALPEGSKIFARRGVKFVRYRDAGGHTTEAKLTKKGNKILCETASWHVKFDDNLSIRREIKAFTNRQATQRLADRIQDLLNAKANNQQLSTELQKCLEQLPVAIRDKLIEFGLLDGKRTAAGRTLQALIDEFEISMQSQELSYRHIAETVSLTRKVFEDCGFKYYSDISANEVETYLKDLRNGPKNISYRRSNSYLKASKQFCNWLIKRGYAHESVLRPLKVLNWRLDRRRERRALEIGEVRRLLVVARQGPERLGVSGHERYLLYRFALETGLRSKEIRSLRKADFNFNANTVTVEANKTKGKRKDTQHLSPGLSDELKDFLQNKMSEAKAFGGRFRQLTDKTADLIKADLDEAGIPYKDEAGMVFDFHALRGECGTLLAVSGVHPKTAQTILRHKDVNMTMNIYTHTLRGQEAQAIASLPDLSVPGKESQKATGTDGRDVTDKILSGSCFQDAHNRTNTDNGGSKNRDTGQKTACPLNSGGPEQTSRPPIRLASAWASQPTKMLSKDLILLC